MSINNVAIVGRCGRDPEAKYFESGTQVAQFSVATNRYNQDEPDWHQVKVWGKQAQVAVDYLRKGHLVGIVGRLEYESWNDKTTGEKRTKAVVVADRIQLLTPKSEASAQREQPSSSAWDDSEEEVPF